MEGRFTDPIVAIDGNSLLHRAFHALPPTMTAPDGRPTNAAFGFISMLLKIVQDLEPQGVVVAFDRGRPAFREEALACYKAHRPKTPDELRVQFPMIKELLEALAVPVIEADGWEGDDVLGTIARLAEELGAQALLVTGDRDALQLVSDHVKVVTTRKGIADIVIYDSSAVLERYGVTPEQIPDYLGLKGDTSDNIPGVKGVGEKTAAKLIAEYGTLEAVLSAAGSIKGKLGENLQLYAEDARVSRLVATIRRDVPIDLDLTSVSWGKFDPARVAEAFAALRFSQAVIGRVLARGHQDASASMAGVKPAAPTDVWRQTASQATTGLVAQWAATDGWLGIAFDDGTCDSLFASRCDLALADPTRREVTLVTGDAAEGALTALLGGSARIACGDWKATVHALCPPEAGGSFDAAIEAFGPERTFDCGIAAYLLESNRNSYQLDALAADLLPGHIPAGPGRENMASHESRLAAEVAPILASRLHEDGSADVFERIEMPLVPILSRMERTGVGLDTQVLLELGEEVAGRLEGIATAIYGYAGGEFCIDSPKQLSEVLFEKLGLPTQKRKKTGYSTDASVLAALAPMHPIAEEVVAYRELAKLKSTYIDALPALVAADGRIHTTFNQTVAATGRLSSSAPNLQNIPVRTELGRRIRAAFVPAIEGDLIVAADYSQIELRILAHLSGDQGLIEAFTDGRDFHAVTASRVFGVPVEDVPQGYRAKAKAVNFGIVYGQSAHGLADSLKIGHGEAQDMIDRYYAAYPRVRAYLDETVASAHRLGYASTLFGRKRRIPELKSPNFNLRAFGERTAMNHPMQGTAADIMKLAMIEVDRKLRETKLEARMLLQVHDELVFECPAQELQALTTLAEEAMAGVAELAVPLEVGVAAGKNWAVAK
ncbi:MAG: DNA polymerase I [Actinobacteria bacterium]|nr:DNA polymerase I [Actinomycetota bacterium]